MLDWIQKRTGHREFRSPSRLKEALNPSRIFVGGVPHLCGWRGKLDWSHRVEVLSHIRRPCIAHAHLFGLPLDVPFAQPAGETIHQAPCEIGLGPTLRSIRPVAGLRPIFDIDFRRGSGGRQPPAGGLGGGRGFIGVIDTCSMEAYLPPEDRSVRGPARLGGRWA